MVSGPWSVVGLAAGVTWWLVLLAACALPFVASSAALVVDAIVRGRGRGEPLPETAGAWLERRIAEGGPPLRVEVHPRGGFDVYWPTVAAIGLSAETARGEAPADWAVAAHELGHARTSLGHPWRAQIFAVARALAGLAWRAFVAALLVAAAYGEPWLAPIACGLLATAIVAQAVVVADEAAASLAAWRMLSAEPRVPSGGRRFAARALASAFGVYAAALVAEIAVAVLWPVLSRAALDGAAHLGTWQPPTAAAWIAVALLPLLVLRAMQVVSQVVSPEPVTTEFQLVSRLGREQQWELATAAAVAVLLATTAGAGRGPVFAISVALAVTTLVRPASGLLRGVLAFVARLVWRPRRSDGARPRLKVVGRPPPEDDESALLAVYSRPPWTVRLTWLADLAYLPFLLVLVVELLR